MAETYDAWAVVVFRGEGGWQVAQLPPGIAEDLEAVVSAVRGQGAGAFAMVDVADEFFVVVRVVAGEVRFLLSDAGAALDWDLAMQVMDRLDLDLPSDAESLDLWPAGSSRCSRTWASTRWSSARSSTTRRRTPTRCCPRSRPAGFADAYEQVVEALAVLAWLHYVLL